MSGRKSRTKGAVGERELASILRAYGFDATRSRIGVTAQDITHNIPGIHIECKRAETIQLPKWWGQASGDCPIDREPVLVFRANGMPWRVVCELTHYLELQRKLANR